MQLTLIILTAISGLELLLWLPFVWRLRKVVSTCLVIGVACVGIASLAFALSVWSGLLAIVYVYRLVNLLRVRLGRSHPDYLYHETARTAGYLAAASVVVVVCELIVQQARLNLHVLWYVVLGLQVGAGALLVLYSVSNRLKMRAPELIGGYANKDLPTLTVAIPARNETDELTDCLQMLLKSTYPKLEIIVLDDCSQNRRTSEIISSFAHDGVRFIAGDVPSEHWLAKNFAYEQLAGKANGDYVLFCGVDTRFESDTLKKMMHTMLQTKREMVSFVPRNTVPSLSDLEAFVVQPVRYAWEVARSFSWSDWPSVLSTCWVIKRESLEAVGGFAAVSRAILPERYFAKMCRQRDLGGYSLLAANTGMSVTTYKSLDEQRATAIRTRYPLTHRRPEVVLLMSVLEVLLLVAPFSILLAALVTQSWLFAAISGTSCLLLIVFYALVMQLTYRRFLLRSLILFPFAALYDIGLVNYSMWRYEFQEVNWKGRNVCIPVMRIIPRLPKV